MREWWSKLRAVFTRENLDQDLSAEVSAHLQMEMEANLDLGMTPKDALEAAKRNFGNRTIIQESSREAWAFLWLEAFVQDLRYGLRVLRRSPGFALTAISVIALGIGANTAAFTLLDYVLLRPLPYPHPDELVTLHETQLANGYPRIQMSPLDYLDWRSMSKSFDSMGAYVSILFPVNLSGQGEPRRLDSALINSDVLKTLGVQAAAGRGFTAEDDRDGAANVALLSNNLATTLFGSVKAAVGRTLSLDNQVHTVIGVMPPGFAIPSRGAALWRPLRFSPAMLSQRRDPVLYAVARLRPEISLEQARAEANLIAKQLEHAYPKDNVGTGATVVQMRAMLSPQSQMLVLAVFGAAFCVLLIACTNLANLLYARSLVRKQEIAVRIAIGAARERLLRQLLTESLLLATLGGAFGSLMAMIVTPLLSRLVPNALPIGGIPKVDLRVLAFAAVITLLTSIAFGVGPALRSFRNVDVNALRSRSGLGGRSDRLRSALVLAEIAGTVILLVGAGLLVKALWRVQAVDPGFRAEGVLTLRTALPIPKYGANVARREFYSRVLNETRALPGVTFAAYISYHPMDPTSGMAPVTVPGVTDDLATAPRAVIHFVTADYFATLRIPLHRGRSVTDRDDAMAPFVAVISESLAQRLWPGADPIGRNLNSVGSDRSVVGVVGDIAVDGPEYARRPQIYFPADQLEPNWTYYAPKDLVIRAGDPMTLVPALRRIIRQVDPDQAVSDVRSLEDVVSSQTASRRDQLLVLGTFASIALLMAAIGIHGLLSFTVAVRTKEVGVRVALGAARSNILGMFLRQGLALGAAGVSVALPLAYLAASGLGSLLFGVRPDDPVIYGAAGLLALLMILAGSLGPALRAPSIDPAITIRAE